MARESDIKRLTNSLFKLAATFEESDIKRIAALTSATERLAVAMESIATHLVKEKPPPAPLTAEQVAERLGVSADKVYTMARKKELKSVKHGRAVRFALADIERYLADQRPRLLSD